MAGRLFEYRLSIALGLGALFALVVLIGTDGAGDHREVEAAPQATAQIASASSTDLVVKEMKIELETGSDCDFPSTQLGVAVTVSNVGTQAAAGFTVDVNGAQQAVPGGLPAGGETRLWFVGYEQFDPNVATVDALDDVKESNESNNSNSKTLPVPTLPPTCTPLVTATPTITVTPTPKDPFADTDGDTIPNDTDPDDDNDGCSDDQENGSDQTLGGRRNPHIKWDFYDVPGLNGEDPDRVIDLSNDVLGVINHYAPTGAEPAYDAAFDRGPSTGPYPWNMTAPDGVIDLSNDILGVINQHGHDCS